MNINNLYFLNRDGQRAVFLVIALFILCFLEMGVPAYASECPAPFELKRGEWQGFQAFDIDNGTLVSKERLQIFQAKVDQLTLVEWMHDAPEGAAHCYYVGKKARELNVYLAKENLFPKSDTHWFKKNANVMQCNPQNGACLFETFVAINRW